MAIPPRWCHAGTGIPPRQSHADDTGTHPRRCHAATENPPGGVTPPRAGRPALTHGGPGGTGHVRQALSDRCPQALQPGVTMGYGFRTGAGRVPGARVRRGRYGPGCDRPERTATGRASGHYVKESQG
ncbi:hypothetical protein GCM10010270_04420 [Streptomyces violaceus]|nr:hypothetical protein GCM10010270_04420 [Streptomyces janthinus]